MANVNHSQCLESKWRGMKVLNGEIEKLVLKVRELEAILGAADSVMLEIKGVIQGDSDMATVLEKVAAYDTDRGKV